MVEAYLEAELLADEIEDRPHELVRRRHHYGAVGQLLAVATQAAHVRGACGACEGRAAVQRGEVR